MFIMGCNVYASNLLHLPSFEKRSNSNTVWRSLNNVAFPETICGVGNTPLTAKARHTIISVPNMAHLQKKRSLQIPTSLSHEGRYFEGIGFQNPPKRSRYLLQTFCSNGTIEPENIRVFLSFRGETRAAFASNLHKEMTWAGYSTFIDKKMKRGVNIEEELMKAIRNAELSLVVISPGYASSQSCLNELVDILCHRRFGHIVLPVFYHLDPDDVHNLTGNFGAAFDGLVISLEDTADNKIRVSCWKKALKEVAGISGLVLREHQCESEFIDQIVAEVKQQLGPPPWSVTSLVCLACVLSTYGFILPQLFNFISWQSAHLPHW